MGSVRKYNGVNVQYPISQLIISGAKTVETRTYPVPSNYLNKEVAIVETPGKSGNFKSRVVAIVMFTSCFKYKSKTQFYEDYIRHQVDAQSPWAWKDKPKWGWELKVVRVIQPPILLRNKRIGIRYTKNLEL